MERRLTKEDAQRLCRICKSNGFFVNVEYDLEEHSYVVTIKEVKVQSEMQDYENALHDVISNVDVLGGWVKNKKIYIPKINLNEFLTVRDIDTKMFMKWLEDAGRIAKRGKGNRTSTARRNEKVIRCAIIYDIDSEEEC